MKCLLFKKLFFGKVVGTDKRVARVARILFKKLFFGMYRVVGIDVRVAEMLFKSCSLTEFLVLIHDLLKCYSKKLIFDGIVRIDARVVQVLLCVELLVYWALRRLRQLGRSFLSHSQTRLLLPLPFTHRNFFPSFLNSNLSPLKVGISQVILWDILPHKSDPINL